MILYTESLFSLEIGTETMFQTDLYQSSLSVYCIRLTMWHRPWGSFKLYKESIIVLAFLIISGIHQIWIIKTLLQPIFVLNWILYVFHYFILNTPYLIIIKSIFLIFAIYVSKVNTSLKNKICFENIYFPSKFIKLCPENLKNIQTKFHCDRMKHKHFIEVSNICPTIILIYSVN